MVRWVERRAARITAEGLAPEYALAAAVEAAVSGRGDGPRALREASIGDRSSLYLQLLDGAKLGDDSAAHDRRKRTGSYFT
ncbi:MAG: hypothetical protein ACRC1K_04605, partial [Planctomycetia bacterium]